MVIEIKNKRNYSGPGVYCGRPTPLGNRFTMTNESQRDWACDQYKTWFDQQVEQKTPPVMRMLIDLTLEFV